MMKKMLKQNKGFSLVELLVAILIMAVIAGTAIMLFGGVLSSSRKSADEETAENIKRAILTYMSMTNDIDLDCLVVDNSNSSSKDLIAKLCCTIKIEDGDSTSYKKKVTFTKPALGKVDGDIDEVKSGDASDINGTYGPFLDASKELTPKTPDTQGWCIQIDKDAQVVTVEATKEADECVVKFVNSSTSPSPTGTP
ncbi:MAG TPA: type II secretion system protein [Thermoclostridium sp.]